MNQKNFYFLSGFLLLVLLLVQPVRATVLCFVHIGETLPSYLPTAVKQARLFNKEIAIYVLAEKKALLRHLRFMDEQAVKPIFLHELHKSKSHDRFLTTISFKPGIWRYAIERFLYLDDFMEQYGIEELFHLENDVMLYADLAKLQPIFTKNYKGIAAVFDSDARCIPSFLYISSPSVMKAMANFFTMQAKTGKADMALISLFKDKNNASIINNLPIVPPFYKIFYELRNQLKQTAKDPDKYSLHFEEFQGVFDAAALGQYLGGIDPIHTSKNTIGFRNETTLFDPAHFAYEWHRDEENRLIPYLRLSNLNFNQSKIRINNLHTHSKNLYSFSSDRE